MKRFLLILLLTMSIVAMSNPTSVDAFRGDLKDTIYNASRWTEKRTGASRKSIKDKFVLVDAVASGNVTSVGDCTSGACLDGTSDGGTFISIYDGDSNKVTLGMADLGSDLVVDIPATLTTTNFGYMTGLTSAVQTQLDARALESVVGTAIGGGIILDSTTLKTSLTLQSLDGLTETNGGLPYGTGDNSYAWLNAGAQGTLLMGNGAAAPSFLAAGPLNYFLMGAGAADPVWTERPAGVFTTVDATGIIVGGVGTVTDSDGFTMTADQCLGTVIYATGAGTIVICPAIAGGNFSAEIHAAAPVVFDPDASGTEDTIRLNGVDLAQGANVTCTALTDVLVVTYYAADKWSMRATSGCTGP